VRTAERNSRRSGGAALTVTASRTTSASSRRAGRRRAADGRPSPIRAPRVRCVAGSLKRSAGAGSNDVGWRRHLGSVHHRQPSHVWSCLGSRMSARLGWQRPLAFRLATAPSSDAVSGFRIRGTGRRCSWLGFSRRGESFVRGGSGSRSEVTGPVHPSESDMREGLRPQRHSRLADLGRGSRRS